LLDYVTGWYFKAARYIAGTPITVAFVSTNSITQGEQVGVLWQEMFQRYGISIFFAHRTFAWQSEAKGKAHVHVVIVGCGLGNQRQRKLFEYDSLNSEPALRVVANISPYLIDGPSLAVTNRQRPLCDVPEIGIGNKPIDDGKFLFTDVEKQAFVRSESSSRKFFRRWYGADEFLNGNPRWCLWLRDCSPRELREMPRVLERVEAVKDFRARSKSAPTRKLAEFPTRFHVENTPSRQYLVIPKVSSERRRFIPIAFMSPKVLCSDLLFIFPNARRFHFGVLSSTMHMAWVRLVAGRLKSDFRYSAKLVYNNFPWPQEVSEAKNRAVEDTAQEVLDARDAHPDATLADLYDPLSMPAHLAKAHARLDRAVDRCYRSQPFANERNRVEFLFGLYQRLTTPLLPAPKSRRGKS
jgi:hypothetical protein